MSEQTQGRSAIPPFILVLNLLEADNKEYKVGVLILQGFWLKMCLLMHRILVKIMCA